MRFLSLPGLGVVALATLGATSSAFASCQGAAPSQALQQFISDPGKYMGDHGGPNAGAGLKALAAAAVNAKDANFGSALHTALLGLGADAAKDAGRNLGHLSASCSDPQDQGKADTQYIQENIAKNMPVNEAANAEFGRASDQTQTASTGGGGGGGAGGGAGGGGGGGAGAGTSAVASQIPTGGSNTGGGAAADVGRSSPTSGEQSAGGSVGAAGATTAGTQSVL